MELSARILQAFQLVAIDVKSIFSKMGNLTSLTTTNKNDLVSAINEAAGKSFATTATSGVVAGADTSLDVEHTGPSTAVSYAHRSQLNYVTDGSIVSGGWLSAYGGMVNITGNGNVDKVVGNFSQSHFNNNGIVQAALGYEAVISTIGASTDVKAWAAYYVPYMRNVANIDTVDALGAFVNDDPMAMSWTLAPFFNALRQEFAPAEHIGIISGRAYTAAYETTAESALAANTNYLVPVSVPHRTELKALGIEVTTPGAGGTKIRLGVYTCVSGKVGSLKFQTAELDGASGGIKEVATSGVILDAGMHWLVVSANSAVGIRWHFGSAANRAACYGNSNPLNNASTLEYLAYINSAYGEYPASINVVPTFANVDGEPHIWFKGIESTGYGAMGSGSGNMLGQAVSNSKVVTVDFGTVPVHSKSFTVNIPGAKVGDVVVCSPSIIMPDSLDSDELEADMITAAAGVTAPDTVKIIASSVGDLITGRRTINLIFGVV